ncbi:universal stress protein [Zavarzinia aquatilis]|uniref:Universal stress protein n=1 Tax=Zavarzinia aquatilis TaxID=2211142 RepID=A0A317DZU7_9PROT|nr:universal stress protein [Zavarzinia aquatilis]PWR19406.1 universal stress protein [Zavarzinia aquatilis]
MYKHLLVPTDGSALSLAAVDSAFALAKEMGASVSVLAVAEPYPTIYYTEVLQVDTLRAEFEQRALDQAKAAVADARTKAEALGLACDAAVVVHAEPYKAIVDQADAKGCDLIVMASNGRRGISALLLGSVTTKVLTHSKIPVLVYR